MKEKRPDEHNQQEDLYGRQKPEAGNREASGRWLFGLRRHHRRPPTSADV